jgi:hypothetical protein
MSYYPTETPYSLHRSNSKNWRTGGLAKKRRVHGVIVMKKKLEAADEREVNPIQ